MRFFFFTLFVIIISCKKQTIQVPMGEPVPRKIKFAIYTTENFSNNNNIIDLTLTIRNNAGREVWDSVLPGMKIKDIPARQHALIIEKAIEHDPATILRAGVVYAIEHVGISWYFDSLRAGELHKTIDFNFR